MRKLNQITQRTLDPHQALKSVLQNALPALLVTQTRDVAPPHSSSSVNMWGTDDEGMSTDHLYLAGTTTGLASPRVHLADEDRSLDRSSSEDGSAPRSYSGSGGEAAEPLEVAVELISVTGMAG